MNIEDLLNRCKESEHEVLRIRTLYEERSKRLEELRNECVESGFDPDNLEEALIELEALKDESLKSLSTLLDKLEGEILKFNDK